jgi:hypothetical protein
MHLTLERRPVPIAIRQFKRLRQREPDMLCYLVLSCLFVLAEFAFAYWDGYAFPWQVRASAPHPAVFLDFSRHAGMWSDFLIINPILSYLLYTHGKSWDLGEVAIVFTVTALAGTISLIPLLEDSRTTPSAFSRDGLLTVVGAMHHVYFIVGTTAIIMFYIFTPVRLIKSGEAIIITICVLVHWALGVLQPAWVVRGSVHLAGKLLTGIGWAFLIGLAAYLLYHIQAIEN